MQLQIFRTDFLRYNNSCETEFSRHYIVVFEQLILQLATDFVAETGNNHSHTKSLLKGMFYHKQFIISFVNKILLLYYIIQLRMNV